MTIVHRYVDIPRVQRALLFGAARAGGAGSSSCVVSRPSDDSR